jgi:hypothetical protein
MPPWRSNSLRRSFVSRPSLSSRDLRTRPCQRPEPLCLNRQNVHHARASVGGISQIKFIEFTASARIFPLKPAVPVYQPIQPIPGSPGLGKVVRGCERSATRVPESRVSLAKCLPSLSLFLNVNRPPSPSISPRLVRHSPPTFQFTHHPCTSYLLHHL